MDFNVLGHFRKPITSTIQEKYQHNSFHNTENRTRPFILRFVQKIQSKKTLLKHQIHLININNQAQWTSQPSQNLRFHSEIKTPKSKESMNPRINQSKEMKFLTESAKYHSPTASSSSSRWSPLAPTSRWSTAVSLFLLVARARWRARLEDDDARRGERKKRLRSGASEEDRWWWPSKLLLLEILFFSSLLSFAGTACENGWRRI